MSIDRSEFKREPSVQQLPEKARKEYSELQTKINTLQTQLMEINKNPSYPLRSKEPKIKIINSEIEKLVAAQNQILKKK